MERRTPSLIELHCEKLVLAAAGALALYAAWAHLLSSPNAVLYDGRELTPWELNQAILQEARALEERMSVIAAPPPRIPQFHQRLHETHQAGIFGVGDESDGVTLSPKLRLVTVFGVPFDITMSQHAPVRLISPLPPTQPTVTTGRALVATGNQPMAHDADDPREITWVQVVACFDREQQRRALLAAGHPPWASNVYLVGVDLQRQELLAEGSFSPWRDVQPPDASAPQIPTPLFDDRSGRLLNAEALAAAFAEVKASQALLAWPPFAEVVAGDHPPGVAEESDSAGADPGTDVVFLRVHDRDAEPGKIYCYRVRVRLWNRFAGRPHALQDPAEARQAVVAGEWSRPSAPVRAAPRTHFFLLGSSVDRTAANLEVWKWHHGRWLRKSFAATIGDVIGSVATVKTGDVDESGQPVREKVDFNTGVVILDMRAETRALRLGDAKTGRFEWVRRPTLVVVCVDPADGSVSERLHLVDRTDPVRRRLRGP